MLTERLETASSKALRELLKALWLQEGHASDRQACNTWMRRTKRVWTEDMTCLINGRWRCGHSWETKQLISHLGRKQQRAAANLILSPPPTVIAMLAPWELRTQWSGEGKEGKWKSGSRPWNNWFYLEMTKLRNMPSDKQKLNPVSKN